MGILCTCYYLIYYEFDLILGQENTFGMFNSLGYMEEAHSGVRIIII